MKHFITALLIATTALACSCKTKPIVVPSFYFWKSNSFRLSDTEKNYIDTLHIQKLYVKFFEVAKDQVWGNAPVSKTNLEIYWWDSIRAEIIPVAFLKNEVLQHCSKAGLDSLAENIAYLSGKMMKQRFKKEHKEIQIDCDWTQPTKENYFYFLKKIKERSRKVISVTLRLYPYKYPDKMGVPPADKATLMCYNLVNALKNPSKNSILEIDELRQYLPKSKKYPLHIDVALPAYSWMLVYQNDQFRGVISQQNETLLNTLTQLQPLWYEVARDTVVDDYYLRRGDKIKYENVSPDALQQTIELIVNNTELGDTVTVSVFHLDEHKLNNYSYEILNSVYTAFNK